MAHFAKLDDNNIVLQVNVVNNEDINNLDFPESEAVGIQFLTNWSGGYSNWKQTSFNGNFRKNYAGIGFSYDEPRNAFIAPRPYISWVLNEDTCIWESPTPMPTDIGTVENPKFYKWNESTFAWDLLND